MVLVLRFGIEIRIKSGMELHMIVCITKAKCDNKSKKEDLEQQQYRNVTKSNHRTNQLNHCNLRNLRARGKNINKRNGENFW